MSNTNDFAAHARTTARAMRALDAAEAALAAWREGPDGEALAAAQVAARAATKKAADSRSMISMKSGAEVARLRRSAAAAAAETDRLDEPRRALSRAVSAAREEEAASRGAAIEALGLDRYAPVTEEMAREAGHGEVVASLFRPWNRGGVTPEMWEAAAVVHSALDGRDPGKPGIVVLGSSDPKALTLTQPHVTVEAEYGDAVVEGSALTMAHHGPRAGAKCPASYDGFDVSGALLKAGFAEVTNRFEAEVSGPIICGVSHMDLDTLGGLMAVEECAGGGGKGYGQTARAFWALAEWVDVRGPHRLAESPHACRVEAVDCLRAFWAWSAANRGPRLGAEVVNLTAYYYEAASVVRDLLCEPAIGRREWLDRRAALLKAGAEFAAREDALRVSSLVTTSPCGRVVLRSAAGFVNHLYPAAPGAAVVAINTATGAVTVSFADGAESPHSAVDVVQALWGSLAGGHRGISGSPRGQTMTMADAETAFTAVCGMVAK